MTRLMPAVFRADLSTVIAGLDPAIHRFDEIFLLMDARVISAFTRVFDALLPGHDELRAAAGIP